MTREIPLWRPKASPGLFYLVLVDDEDYIRVLEAGPWGIIKGPTTYYAEHRLAVDGVKRRGCKRELLHRFLMKESLRDGLEVEHVSGNGLDCRRHNMKVVTHQENLQNIQRDTSNRKRPKTSRYRGVTWDKNQERWVAQVAPNSRHVFLGRFDDELEAARVAALARKQYFQFANESRHPVVLE